MNDCSPSCYSKGTTMCNQFCESFVFIWINILILSRIVTVEAVYSAAKETEIRSETVLAASYDMISRPAATTNIKVGISVLAIDELDLRSQKFQAAGWVTLEWEDSRLTWTPAAKDDIEEIFSKPGDIWKPELVVDNSMEDLGIITDSNLYLRIKYDGTVEWEPPRLFTTHCEVDITYYPYDKQKCSIKIAGWGYTSDEVSLDTLSTAVNVDDFEQHGEWKITSSSFAKSTLVETLDDGTQRQFPQIEFKLSLERRSAYYNLNVVMPVLLTSLLVALTFIVPVECGEKLSYILTVFLSIAVLLTLVADSMPSTSITTSVLGLYLALVTILSAIGILLTVIIIILFHKEGSAKSRSCIMIITRVAAKVTCSSVTLRDVSTNRIEPLDDEDDVKSDVKTNVFCDVTWRNVAIILDRFCFFVFSTVTVLMNLAFVIALVAGGNASDP